MHDARGRRIHDQISRGVRSGGNDSADPVLPRAASQNAGDNRWIKLICFNDPYVIGLYGPKVRSYSGHDDHFHVRFCVAYYPGDASYDC